MKNRLFLAENKQELAFQLKKHVKMLSHHIGPRNYRHYPALQQSADYIRGVFQEYHYSPTQNEYTLKDKIFANIEAELSGVTSPNQLVVIGAHYDTAKNSPGANDNASGVAVMLELARLLADTRPDCTIKFVAFTNEEPPFTHTKQMGSYQYAAHLKSSAGAVKAMLSLETLGCYTENRGQYGLPLFKYLFPYKQNFLAFIGNNASNNLVKRVSGIFRQSCTVPTKTLSAWGFLPGIKASDQESFWKNGYHGVMVTDTAWARDWQAYHTADDTYERLNYTILAETTLGLAQAVFFLA